MFTSGFCWLLAGALSFPPIAGRFSIQHWCHLTEPKGSHNGPAYVERPVEDASGSTGRVT